MQPATASPAAVVETGDEVISCCPGDRGPRNDVKQHLTLTLAHAVRSQWRSVFNVGGFQALLEVLSVGAEGVQQDVSSCLGDLLEDTQNRAASYNKTFRLLRRDNIKGNF